VLQKLSAAVSFAHTLFLLNSVKTFKQDRAQIVFSIAA